MTAAAAGIDELMDGLARLESDIQYSWHGDSVIGFQGAAAKMRLASEPVSQYAREAAEVFSAFAERISRGRNTFADYADSAAAAGMTVVGKRFIRAPESPVEFAPTGECLTPDPRSQREYAKLIEMFLEINRLVAMWAADTTDWIHTNIIPLIGKLQTVGGLDVVLKHFDLNGFEILEALLEDAEKRVGERLDDFYERQRAFEEAYEEHQKDKRSNDPRRQARVDEFDKPGNRTALEEVEKHIDRLEPGKVLLRVGGSATGVIGAAVELANGASPSEVGVGVAGGAVGGWVVGLGGAALGAAFPPAAPFLAMGGSVGGSAAGSAVSKATWEAWVPLRTREAIDAGLHDEYRLAERFDPNFRPPMVR
ncbi:hypothetical protein [Leucobacter manosquensis]|uniref:WXG100 family type VII secretion target n=1 Tax=Leucobacter manosquensis TaxID=2810611 RepID=A0ABS5M860_9MICO|nr:hypothetical protein [Leucobacter manosquensis]MBS3183000.1 hypothetical protein [Leucobacter manosquensis]